MEVKVCVGKIDLSVEANVCVGKIDFYVEAKVCVGKIDLEAGGLPGSESANLPYAIFAKGGEFPYSESAICLVKFRVPLLYSTLLYVLE